MFKMPLLAGVLLISAQVGAQAEEALASPMTPDLKRLFRANWYDHYREKVALLRRLHEPGQRNATWLQEDTYLAIMNAVVNLGLKLEELGTGPAELRALVYGGEII